MSENTAPRIDPRFDPRFQRGYDPGDTGTVPTDATATTPADATASVPTDAPVPRRAPHASWRRQVGDDPAEAIRALVASASDARPDAPAAADEPDHRPAAHGDLAPGSIPSPNDRPPIGRLWIALGSSIALVLVSGVLLWNAVTDPLRYTGPAPGFDAEFNQFIWWAMPGLMQAGAIGCVAVLVTWAVLGRRAWARETDG